MREESHIIMVWVRTIAVGPRVTCRRRRDTCPDLPSGVAFPLPSVFFLCFLFVFLVASLSIFIAFTLFSIPITVITALFAVFVIVTTFSLLRRACVLSIFKFNNLLVVFKRLPLGITTELFCLDFDLCLNKVSCFKEI